MITALLSGNHIKPDGTVRLWDCAEYHGSHRKNMLRVTEHGKLKQINLDTFTGIVISHDDIFEFNNGKQVSKDTYYLPF